MVVEVLLAEQIEPVTTFATQHGVQTSKETIEVWIAVRGGPEALDKVFAEPAPAPEPPPAVTPAPEPVTAPPGFFARLFGKAS